MKATRIKLVIYVPTSHTERVLQAIGDAGGGLIGNYSHCSFVLRGTGRFLPLEGANPTIGKVGQLQEVEEDRIETVCEKEKLSAVLEAIRSVHPYEEPAVDVYPIEVVD